MPLPVWPEGLRYQPRRGEWKITPRLPPVETPFQQGNVRRRSQAGDDVRDIEQTIRFTQAQYLQFDAFYQVNGNGRFIMPVFLGGPGYATRTVQFIGEVPPAQVDGLKYPVSMKIRVYPA